MLYIDRHSEDIQFAFEEHFKHVRCLILKRLGVDSRCKDLSCTICTGNLRAVANIPLKIIDLISDNDFLKAVICGEPKDLMFYNELFFRSILTDGVYETIEKILEKKKKERNNEDRFFLILYQYYLEILSNIFDYNGWFNKNEPSSYYSAYHLSTYLNIRSCVYCNRTYTVSQFKTNQNGELGKLIRPQFDHWYPQEKYPLLGLSFYNLIPSCSICNSSVKGRKQFSIDKFLHPYEDNVLDYITFGYVHWKSIDRVKIELIASHPDNNEEKRIENTLVGFHIEEMYNAHHPELLDLLKIKQAYSENYLKKLKDSFPEAGLTEQEIYRLAFGVESAKEDFHKRPMSKFKYDILKELGIIK